MGNHQHRNDDLHLINWGRTFRPEPTFSLVDNGGNVWANMFLKDSLGSYRSYAQDYNFTFPRMDIMCSGGPNSYTLTAPQSSNYRWSTGETTQQITVSDTGTYMVWTAYGIGFIGSHPYTIDNLSATCDLSLSDLPHLPQQIKEVYDLTGRKVNAPSYGQLYLVRHKTGESKLIFWQMGMKIEPQ